MDKIIVSDRIEGKNIHGDTAIVFKILADKVNELIDEVAVLKAAQPKATKKK